MSSDGKVLEEGREEASHETPQAITITIMDPSALETTTLDPTLVTSMQAQDTDQGMSTLLVMPREGHRTKDILQTVTETHMGTQELPVISSISNTEEESQQSTIQVMPKSQDDGEGEGILASVGEAADEEEGDEGDDMGDPLGQHCLICNLEMATTESEEPIPVFKSQTSTTHRKMAVFLGTLVGQKLTSRKAHSDIICRRCFNLLDKVDALEVEIRDTKEEIITKFQETVTAYGGRARRRKPATAKKTDYVFPKVEPEEDILGLEMDENFEPRMEDLLEEEQDHREDRTIQDEEWEPEFKRPKIKREPVEPDPNGPPKRKRGRPRKDASKPKAQREEEEAAPSKLETSHLEGADAAAGEPSNSVRRSGRQRRPSARHPRPQAAPAPSLVRAAPPSPSSNIPPEELAAKLNFEELVCGCGETLASRTDYVDHILTHVAGAFRCPQCPCVYTCSSRLARHQRLLHSRGDTPSDALPHGSPATAPADGVEERCHLCADAVGGGDGDLRNHMRVHLCGEHECPVCALRLDTSYAMEMHVQRKHPSLLHAFLKSEDSLKDESSKSEDSGGLPVRCDVCGKVVATPSRLARHRYLQHPEHYPWPCAACTLAFPSLHARDHHVCPHRRKGGKEASGDGKKNECLVCNTAFKSRVSLECHMRRAHPTEAAGPHACPVCGRSLSSRKALTDHLRCHRREGFACEFCGARLKTLDSLNVHINEIHTHVVRLQCRLCSQVFFSSGRLSYHMKRHHTDRRSYTNLCHLCGKAYPYPSELRLHLRAHRNERPYRCDQCQKTFLKQGDLTYHRRSHTGERPHKCPHCDARFPRPNTLMSHIRQQHRDTTAVAAPTATATTAVNTAATATDAAPSAIAPEAVVTTAAVGAYVSSPPSTVAPPSVSAYLPAGVPVSAPAAVSLQHHRPPTAVTVMGVAGGVGREGGEATLVPVVEGQLVEAVVEGQMTEMQPVQYVQVDGLSAGQTVQTVQAVQAVPHMVEGMEYDEAGSVPYQIVHLQILQ